MLRATCTILSLAFLGLGILGITGVVPLFTTDQIFVNIGEIIFGALGLLAAMFVSGRRESFYQLRRENDQNRKENYQQQREDNEQHRKENDQLRKENDEQRRKVNDQLRKENAEQKKENDRLMRKQNRQHA